MAGRGASTTVIYAALAGNFLIAVVKLGAAAWTGSSAMLSEGVHSLVDTGNELLLLYGVKRAGAAPDRAHPLGYGRELYFWTFVVAILIFAVGAGVSVFEGITHIRKPAPIEDARVSYVVLGLSALFEGASWVIAVREFWASKGEQGIVQALRRSKDPTTFTVLLEDSAALLGIAIAVLGIGAAQMLGRPELDGAASIGIGLVLAATAAFLARETKGLLIGEPADPELEASLLALAGQDPGVEAANDVLTIHLAPRQVVAAFSLDFKPGLGAEDVEASVLGLEKRVRAEHPEVTTIFVKPQAGRIFRERRSGGSGTKSAAGPKEAGV